MSSTVFFATAETSKTRKNLVQQMGRLFDAAGGKDIIGKGDLTAIKLSFSEVGNTAFLRPPLVRQVVRRVKAAGGKPFLTDANTLYVGGRSNSVDHIETAILNGFAYAVVEAPVIIADGLTGKGYETVEINQKHCKTARIGAEVHHAHAIISLAHVHGHGGTGYAGTFKNIGMGLGCRAGKQEMHDQEEPPKVNPDKCVGDGVCVRHCPANAISLVKRKARIDAAACIRCGECTVTCPHQAIAIRWGDGEPDLLQRRVVEYAYAVLKDKLQKSLFYAILLDVTPGCLCMALNERPFIPDVGILAGRDPVAVEQAAFDMVKAQRGLADSPLPSGHEPGEDKYRALYPEMDSEVVMEYAQQLGLGTREYKIEEV